MSTDPRRQSAALLVAATTAVVLTAVVPWAGALEPLDEAAPVTTVVDTVVDEVAPVAGIEETTTTTSSTTTTSTSTTTTTAPEETTTTTAPAPAAAPGATTSTGPAPSPSPSTAPAPAPVAEVVDDAPLTSEGLTFDLDLTAGFGGATLDPPSRVLLGGPRSTVELVGLLQGVGAPPTLVAKILAPFPVAGPATYGDDWGAPRHGGRRHQGTDIFAQRGTPVIASVDGVVGNMTTTAALGGTALRVTADSGTYFYYAHLDRFAPGLTDGTRVARGQVIGFVGNTGNARTTPPHLHFQVHPKGGIAVPPVPYLDRWLGEARTAATAVVGAPAIDALVRPGAQVALAPPPAPTIEVPERRAAGPATALTSSPSGPGPIDPMPLLLLALPAAWLVRHGLREVRAWRALR